MSNDATSDGATRRTQIVALRRGGMSEMEIGARLGLPLEVVQGDIDAFSIELGTRLALEFNSAREVAEARERFSFLIATVEREIGKLDRTPGASTALKLKCVALEADLVERRLKLADTVGLLNIVTAAAASELEGANAIRARLKAAGLFDPELLVSDGERAWLGVDEQDAAQNTE